MASICRIRAEPNLPLSSYGDVRDRARLQQGIGRSGMSYMHGSFKKDNIPSAMQGVGVVHASRLSFSDSYM